MCRPLLVFDGSAIHVPPESHSASPYVPPPHPPQSSPSCTTPLILHSVLSTLSGNQRVDFPSLSCVSCVSSGGTWASGHLILDLRQVVKADVIMGTVIGLLRYLGTRGADRSPRVSGQKATVWCQGTRMKHTYWCVEIRSIGHHGNELPALGILGPSCGLQSYFNSKACVWTSGCDLGGWQKLVMPRRWTEGLEGVHVQMTDGLCLLKAHQPDR